MTNHQLLMVQANENLRATDTKRDHIFYLYVVIFGLFLNFYKDMSETNILLTTVAGSFLALFGIAVSVILTNYQIWHQVYVSTAVILQKIIYREITENLSDELFQNLLSTDSNRSLGYGASFYLFNAVLIINCILISLLTFPLAKMANEISLLGTNSYGLLSATLIIIICLYVAISNLVYKNSIQNAKLHLLDISWLLRR